jgi:hypothetical protein
MNTEGKDRGKRGYGLTEHVEALTVTCAWQGQCVTDRGGGIKGVGYVCDRQIAEGDAPALTSANAEAALPSFHTTLDLSSRVRYLGGGIRLMHRV